MRRLSRPCYDKPWRCPGWVGGGFKYPKGESRCDSGRIIRVGFGDAGWQWKFGVCNTCNVITLPYITRWLAPSWLMHTARWWWRERSNR